MVEWSAILEGRFKSLYKKVVAAHDDTLTRTEVMLDMLLASGVFIRF